MTARDRNQALILLWALGRARMGLPRLAHWSSVEPQLSKLLKRHGVPGSPQSLEHSFIALVAHIELWKEPVDGVPLRCGLRRDVFTTMATDVARRDEAVHALLAEFFGNEDTADLLHDVALDEVPFNGLGPVPGVPVGAMFPNRNAVSAAKVHRPNQAGICVNKLGWAESIVVSGGYNDDVDYGDLIIYTGRGGRDKDTKKQIADQQLTDENAALAANSRSRRPVRVVRGAGGDPAYSPAQGYRYDGLYLVEEFWSEVGKDNFLIWRYLLTALDGAVQPARELAGSRPPSGVATPGRSASQAERVLRSAVVAEWVKQAHSYKCQICGDQLDTPTGPYAETAHIQPLGRPHNGPDIVDNALCLCPNHHKLFDLGAFIIDEDRFVVDVVTGRKMDKLREVPEHSIDPAYLEYHRRHH